MARLRPLDWTRALRRDYPARRLATHEVPPMYPSLTSSSKRPRSERLTAEEEKEIARAIRRAERRAREAIAGLELAEKIVQRRPDRAERTRAGAVDRLEAAVEEVWRASREIAELKDRARKA